MTIKELQNELVLAMKERNQTKKDVMADIMTIAKNSAIEKGCKDDITDDIVDAAILKAKKTCQEQIDTCPAVRTDLLEKYRECMGYINVVAPKMMNEDEVRAAVMDIVIDMDVQHNKGALMKVVMPKLKGKAEGKVINRIIDEIISQTK